MQYSYASTRFKDRFAYIGETYASKPNGRLPFQVYEGSIFVKDFGTFKGADRYLRNKGFVSMTKDEE